MAEEAVDFPFGLAVSEEATVFSLVLRSLEIEEFPLGWDDCLREAFQF